MQKKGISLIVLVITIIVMIILAATVVISLTNTGIIDRANHAVQLTDEKQVQDLAALTWAECYINNLRGDALKQEVITKLEEQGVKIDKYNINISDTGIEVKFNENKITTLAGTAWKFNEHVSGYEEVFEVFNFEEQTGWEEFPAGCYMESGIYKCEISGLTINTMFDTCYFGRVGVDNALGYAEEKAGYWEAGWKHIPEELEYKALIGEMTVEELAAGIVNVSPPILTFSEETNVALMNTELIDWLYENATRIK